LKHDSYDSVAIRETVLSHAVMPKGV